MAAAATPRGRPQYAAPRDEIAPSASGDREPTQPPGSAQRALAARLGKYFRFNSSLKRCISLLRRGARVPLGTRKLELARQQATTALRGRRPIKAEITPAKHPTGAPRRRAQRASYWPDGKEKLSLSARLGDSFYFAISKIVESLLRRGARCLPAPVRAIRARKPSQAARVAC